MRILFVRLSSFGDVVFALPAARALRESAPDATLAWAIEPPLAPIVAGAPYVDEVLEANTRAWRRSIAARSTWWDIRGFLRKGREVRPDLIVDAQGLFKSALITASVRAPRKIGFGWRTATERVNCLFTRDHIEAADRPHILDRMLALAEHVTGRSGFDRVPDVRHLTEREDKAVDGWLAAEERRPFVVLQPFSSKAEKAWGADDVIAFGQHLSSQGLLGVVRWGPGEQDQAASLVADSAGTLVLAPPTTPASTARLAARAALCVGVDTGPTHLAAAAGTPTLALFGPTDPVRFGPVGPRTAVLRVSPGDYNQRRGLGVPADAVALEVDRLLA
jgi:lipopolysaccharide heptosyltransferase I